MIRHMFPIEMGLRVSRPKIYLAVQIVEGGRRYPHRVVFPRLIPNAAKRNSSAGGEFVGRNYSSGIIAFRFSRDCYDV